MTDLRQPQNLTFTTQPKIRRHLTRGTFISRTRATDFMRHLWDCKLKKQCSYSTLEYEFINFFGTNDKRTTERYLGRPEQTIHSKGSTSTVRINRTTGKVAQFAYSNIRKVTKKVGLFETLGLITLKPEEKTFDEDSIRITKKTSNWIVVLHHERLGYFTEQSFLETSNPLQEVNQSDACSNDDLCVRSLLAEETNNNTFLPRGRARETAFGTGVSTTNNMETTENKKEEEVIDSTHTNQSSESEAQEYPELTPEALQLLKASRGAS